MPSTLTDWLTHLESLHPKTIALGLDRVAQVKLRLDLYPDFPVIVVGGTNGKGSVCAMLEAILFAAGYRVGCYTSPHLLHYNERVRVAKQPVSDAELCASFEKIEQARGDIALTYFEFGTLAAMQCFIEHRVEVAILEVGLGGRLDAVNVFDNDCAVVTSVDIDHVDYLGDTREKIAFEKAGIYRAGRVAICADPNVPASLRAHAQDIGAELWCIGSDFGFSLPSPANGRGVGGEGSSNVAKIIFNPQSLSLTLSQWEREQLKMQWDYRSKAGSRNALPHPALRGAFQLNNASAVLAVLDAMQKPLPVSMAAVRRGLTEVQLAGRFQFVPGKPQLILDVAHNPHAARSLAQNFANLPPAKTFAVFAMLKDKDMRGVAELMDPHIDTWLVAGIDAPRGANSGELERVLQTAAVRGKIQRFDDIAAALRFAYKEAGENDRIAAFGSFYTVAAVMQEQGIRVF